MRTSKPLVTFGLALLIALSASACMSNIKATVPPGTDLAVVKHYYVVETPENDPGLAEIIAGQFRSIGLAATAGPRDRMPADTDAVVTFTDRWMWDFTMYLLQLNLTITDARTNLPLATGESMHTSLVRQPPPVMTREILDSIFKKGGSAA